LNKEYICSSEAETTLLGIEFGRSLPQNCIVCFFGDLGAGKTTFIKGLAQGASNFPSEQVNSPTFVYLNIYNGERTIYHFDLYRLRDADEFLSMGFEDFLFAQGICCVEWSEKIQSLLPEGLYKINMEHLGGSKRRIRIEGP
jgi:tRNA threonylcarbamoyladenosine biosynthesis protein TsaE